MHTHDETLRMARSIDTGGYRESTPEVQETGDDRNISPIYSVKEFVLDNPVPSTLIGLGLAWYFLGSPLSEDRRLRRSTDNSSDMREQAVNAVSQLQEKGQVYLETAGEKARSGGEAVSRKYHTLKETSPFTLGLGALGVGLLLGLLLPSTQREDELLGRTRDSLLNQANDIVQAAKEAAVGTLQTTKEDMVEQLEMVKDEAVCAVKDSYEEAKTAALEEARPDKHRQRAKPS